jgi:hypothetical protein
MRLYLKEHEFDMNPKRILTIAALLLMLAFSASGCSLCCSPYTEDYVAFGSRTPRMDMKHGRVGSILSDPQLMGNAYPDPSSGINENVEQIGNPTIEEDSMIIDSIEWVEVGLKTGFEGRIWAVWDGLQNVLDWFENVLPTLQ